MCCQKYANGRTHDAYGTVVDLFAEGMDPVAPEVDADHRASLAASQETPGATALTKTIRALS